ncbi:MAG: LacI family transcriptional regulator [Gemmatimonadaceae bacterium]|jgi:LacI family transcriptional regulator|nr:LacI family transcriptional regulator [Gemmatimonadaceae bacterium]
MALSARSITLHDVARDAGVSAASVSRILTGRFRGEPAVAERVRAIARQLGYVPHGGARALITRRAGAMGVLLPDIFGEFFSELLRGADAAARAAGVQLLVAGAHSAPEELVAAIGAMRGRVDGYLVMAPHTAARAALAQLAAHTPTVVVGASDRAVPFPALVVDNRGGARAMAQHLLACRYDRIAFIGGPRGNADATARRSGFLQALRGSAAARTLIELPGDFNQQAGWDAARALLRAPRRPRALFAANDAMAIGALSALHDAGVRVPDEIAVAGFDDIPMARFLAPSLTTVHVPIAALGERAMQRLLDGVRHGTHATVFREVVPTSLVHRASTGAPADPVTMRGVA